MPFEKLGHQTIHGSPRGAHELEHVRAIALIGEGPHKRLDLALYAFRTQD
jgi:hypothetical protein